MSKEQLQNNVIDVQKAFAEIKKLSSWLPKIKDCVVKADINQIEMADVIKELLCAKNDNEVYHILANSNDLTKDLIGYVYGAGGEQDNRITFQIDKLTGLIQRMAQVQEQQQGESFFKTVKQYEQLVLELNEKNKELQHNINVLLKLQERVAQDAEQKARITARESKKRFRDVANAIDKALEIRRIKQENVTTEDIKKIKRSYPMGGMGDGDIWYNSSKSYRRKI